MFGNNIFITASLILLGIHGVLSTPVITRTFTPPEISADDISIVPGPGLPSLERLNVTAAELVEQAFRELNDNAASSTLSRRLVCHNLAGHIYRASALSCAGYLERLGTTPCAVPYLWDSGGGKYAKMCQATVGGELVEIRGYAPNRATSSHCMHVAHAVRVVEASCVYSDFYGYSGSENAWGNGDLSVEVLPSF